MEIRGHVRQGIIILDEPTELPEGAAVRVELVDAPNATATERRRGGVWKGQVSIADDFDVVPDDIAEAFGIRTP